MLTAKLYWAFCYTSRCQVVFANHPTIGKIFMGRTMEEARETAATTVWLD